ncbi:hypothetical protein [Pseudomonas sp. OIL-1]|uniref:hypothetical protein n=1 Tax=Pseudomonas sp. OIL-1 TaxID=2706126 RepID=UPI0013A7B43D|nr:hypothetical protein [Pseudomonas sp. OIL-1]QIB49868.1 hypothetical protein G3M63_01600 [Pseudomonas sp. OIL-1]
MENNKPLSWISFTLLLSCLPAAANADPIANPSPAEFVQLGNPFLLISVGLTLLAVGLGWLCMRLKHQNMRNQSSAVSALSTMRELIETLQQNEAALRDQVIEQTAELAQMKAHPGQLTLQPSVVALAKSSAQ